MDEAKSRCAMSDAEQHIWPITYAAVIGAYATSTHLAWDAIRERACIEATQAMRALRKRVAEGVGR